jgi:hypothetical protein
VSKIRNYQDELRSYLINNNFNIVFLNIDEVPEEQFAQIRMSGLGASDSSKLLEVNPFPNGTLENLILEKVTGEYDESIGLKGSVRMGKELEPLVIEKTQKIINQTKYCEGVIIKPKDMFGDENHLNVNFDGVLVNYDVIFPIEIKIVTKYGKRYYNFNRSNFYTKHGVLEQREEPIKFELAVETNIQQHCKLAAEHYGIPVYYYTQLQQQIYALNAPYGILSILDIDEWDVHMFLVHRDNFVIEELKSRAKNTWTLIETKKQLKEESSNE